MKVVFDTNVLIAAFVTEGLCAKLLVRAREREFQLVACPFILREFERVLTKKFKAAKSEVQDALALAAEAAQAVVEPKEKVVGVCRDTDDDNVLACVLEAEANYLVTGDADLLELKEFRETRIVAPRDFELLFED